jgi:GT2 family glycosyltransferase
MGALTFSVIVPSYRRPEQLAACLRSLARQTCSSADFEVIVVDDAGMPRALAPIAEAGYPFVCHLVSQNNRGAAAARNAGARIARGRLLAFTDDDCEPEPGWLEILGRTMAAGAEGALVGGRVVNALIRNRFASATQTLVDFLVEHDSVNARPGRLLTSNNLCVPSVAFHELGGFDPAFRGAGGEDREFCLRWAHGGRRAVYAPEAVVRHAHDLTLAGFLRQHYAYGRGSALLRQRALAHGYGPLPLERASFYWELLRYPQRACGVRGRAEQSLLFLLSQLATAAGYCQARCSEAK